MTAADLRTFHRWTEHSPGSPARGGPFDPAIEPAKIKGYRTLEVEPLPDAWPEPETAAASVLSSDGGQQDRRRTPASLDRRSVARLLFLSHGTSRTMRRAGRQRRFRTAPSAGALYPVEVYLVCGALPDLPAGVYHHEPEQHGLHRLRTGDHRAALAAAADDDAIATAPLTLVYTGILWRTSWKYGPRGYRHLYWDAGVILANTLVAAGAAGWPGEVMAGFVDHEVARLLDLGTHQPFAEWPLALARIGSDHTPAAGPDDPGAVEPLAFDVEPLSQRQHDEPEAREIHEATTIGDRAQVSGWRETLARLDLPDAAAAPEPPAGVDPITVDELILRRGSTRAFSPAALPDDGARWCLAAGMRAVPGDLAAPGATPLQAYVAVHAVEGLDPGGYRWTPAEFGQVTADQPREVTAHLCLDQELGGAAALTVVLCAGLDHLLDGAGPRAYRLGQLAAGIAAGRMQLAAFALEAGGTGLTFYDDELRRHFGTSADPMLVTAIGHPAYRARPGNRPVARSGAG